MEMHLVSQERVEILKRNIKNVEENLNEIKKSIKTVLQNLKTSSN